MLRRSFLTGITSATLGLSARGLARTQGPSDVRISIDAAAPQGLHIPSDFIGLSYESAILADEDFVSPDNTSLIGLIRRLGHAGRSCCWAMARSMWHAGDPSQRPRSRSTA